MGRGADGAAGAGLGVGDEADEAGGVLLHEAVQRGLLGVVAFAAERGAFRCHRPYKGLRAGCHDGLPKG